MALLHDLRYAGRTLLRERATSTVVILTLALGISASAIMFGVVDQLLLRPPAGIGHADAVRRLYFGSEAPAASGARVRAQPNSSYPAIAAIRDGVPAFSGAAATYRTDVTLGVGPDARRVHIELVNADYFPLLELVPAAGHFFTRTADRVPHGDPVVVVSHAFWMREFRADPGAVGRELLFEGKRLTILGVAPAGFSGIDRERVDFWAPPGALGRDLLGDGWASTVNVYRFELVARLSPGATDAEARAQSTAVYRRALADGGNAGDDAMVLAVPLSGLHDPNGLAFQAQVGLWLLGVSGLVVMIACANVASLLLARTIMRRREIAVRVAIGASRSRLLRQLLTESALLSTIAAAAALLLTYVGGRLVQQLLLPGFVWDDGVVDERVLAATAGVSAFTALATGLGPALHALSADVISAIRPAQRVTRGRAGALRVGLLVTQIALSVVLLVGAGLFVKSLAAVRATDVGIDIDRVIQASLPSTLPPATAQALYAEATERLIGIPGIERVALGGGSSRLRTGASRSMTPEGMTSDDVKDRAMDAYFVVTPGYFATLGATIERGRDLTAEDEQTRARVAVITRALADRFWPGADAVGRCVSFRITFSRNDCTTVVGVVENVLLHNRTLIDSAQVYVLSSHPEFAGDAPTALLIRTGADARTLVPRVRRTLQSLTPDMRFVAVDTLEAMLAPQLQPWRLGQSMFLAFGGVALLIAAVGLYSSMAFSVSQRRHEIGIRLALGASRWDITATIGVSGALTMAAGIGLGLLGAALGTRWLSDLLYQTSPRDLLVFTVVAVVLALAGGVASIVPARRAASVDPLAVLKAD